MTIKKAARYGRQEILPEIGVAGQKKLAAARVLVVGAGGLGCPVLQYLAGAGVGTLGIVDHDSVDISNLQRQILYATEDQGKQKAVAARERLLLLNLDITINAYSEELTERNALGLFSVYDVIVDGTDNFSAKFLINDAAIRTGKPVIYGAIQGFEGQVSVFGVSQGPCYRCLHPQPPKSTVLNCAEAGVIGALAGIVGTVQAMEVIKLIVGHSTFCSLAGKFWMIDVRTMETRIMKLPKQENCPTCSKAPLEILLPNYSPVCSAVMVEEIDCSDLTALPNSILIDVRELSEWEAGHIEGARHLPLSLLQKNPDAFCSPENGNTCVLYCQKGMRSRKAAQILLTTGFSNIRCLKGGYDAWCGAIIQVISFLTKSPQ